VTTTPEAPRASNTVDELYRKHGAEVYRYAYGVLGNRPDAEDMMQSTFVNALRALERGEEPRKPGNWLITIAHNVARERFRRSQSRPTEVAFDVDAIEAGPSNAEDALSLGELTQALGRIPAPQRSALVLREFEGRPYAEIARILGITTGALETLLFRARRSLAEELENVVTCERAALDIDRLRNGAIGRKDRRRLDDHLRECASCARLLKLEQGPKRTLRGLAWLPLSFPLNLFRGGHKALTTAALHGPEAAAGASGGGLAVGAGLAAKVTAVVLAATVAGGLGYAGVQDVRAHSPAKQRAQPDAHGTRSLTRATKATPRFTLEPVAPGGANAAAHGKPPEASAHSTGARAASAPATAGGKSAIAPGQDATKTNPAVKTDRTKTLPDKARTGGNAASRTTTPADPSAAQGKSGNAPGTAQPDPAQATSGNGSAAGNARQGSKK
jgi:RNA polymerase sigma factor (sigma-70 family)